MAEAVRTHGAARGTWLGRAAVYTIAILTLLQGLGRLIRHRTDRGVLAAGLRADFVLWDVRQPAELVYAIGSNPHIQTIYRGGPR